MQMHIYLIKRAAVNEIILDLIKNILMLFCYSCNCIEKNAKKSREDFRRCLSHLLFSTSMSTETNITSNL